VTAPPVRRSPRVRKQLPGVQSWTASPCPIRAGDVSRHVGEETAHGKSTLRRPRRNHVPESGRADLAGRPAPFAGVSEAGAEASFLINKERNLAEKLSVRSQPIHRKGAATLRAAPRLAAAAMNDRAAVMLERVGYEVRRPRLVGRAGRGKAARSFEIATRPCPGARI